MSGKKQAIHIYSVVDSGSRLILSSLSNTLLLSFTCFCSCCQFITVTDCLSPPSYNRQGHVSSESELKASLETLEAPLMARVAIFPLRRAFHIANLSRPNKMLMKHLYSCPKPTSTLAPEQNIQMWRGLPRSQPTANKYSVQMFKLTQNCPPLSLSKKRKWAERESSTETKTDRIRVAI